MKDCTECDFLSIKMNENDKDDYYYCDKNSRYMNNLHENITTIPDWCTLKPRPINEKF
jgi:hypothetical protein